MPALKFKSCMSDLAGNFTWQLLPASLPRFKKHQLHTFVLL